MTHDIDHIFSKDDVLLLDNPNNSIASIASECAIQAFHGLGYLIYPGSGINDSADNVFEIHFDHLKEANRHLMRANKNMHRSWPRQNMVHDNSLRRDMWLARWCHAIYIVGLFTQDASLLKINTDVAWSAQMYVDRFLYDQEPMELCELFLFDQKSEAWWQWQGSWSMMRPGPKASGIYTIMCQEKLSNAGKDAIRTLY